MLTGGVVWKQVAGCEVAGIRASEAQDVRGFEGALVGVDDDDMVVTVARGGVVRCGSG